MNKSESIKELAIALAKANGEVGRISKDASNPFFKNTYATLDQIVDEIRPILTKHGLSILQMPSGDGVKVSVTTLLIHESGEWIESEPLIMQPVKNDPQGMGSAITYARRYSLSAFLSLNTGEDDDGNKASTSNANQSTKQPQQRNANNKEGQSKEDILAKTELAEYATSKGVDPKSLRALINKQPNDWTVTDCEFLRQKIDAQLKQGA